MSSAFLPSQNGVKLQNTPDHVSEHTFPDRIMRRSESLGIDESVQNWGLLGNSPSTVIVVMKERDWMMKHRHAKLSVKNNGVTGKVSWILPQRYKPYLMFIFHQNSFRVRFFPFFICVLIILLIFARCKCHNKGNFISEKRPKFLACL